MPAAAAKRKAKAKKIASKTPTEVVEKNPRAWTSLTPSLSPWMLDAVSSLGFERMTPVQASTIPLFMGNKDVVVEAITGSGKTLAFLIPVIERILRAQEQVHKNHVAVIIVSPTRELASQIHTVLLSLLEFHAPSAVWISNSESKNTAEETPTAPIASGPQIRPLLLLGGNTSPAQDLRNFLEQSPNLFIGTPGRLNELLSSQHVHCSTDTFEALVLDEADRLLDLGFKETLSKIISRLPKQRRTGLFSATISDAVVGSLVRTGLRNPVKIVVKVRGTNNEKRTPASLEMTYQLATPSQRLVYMKRILSPEGVTIFATDAIPQKTIVYFSNCAAVDYFTSLFPALLEADSAAMSVTRYCIIPLHGKMNSTMRHRNFLKFSNASSPAILLTTDLAARGLDIPEVDLVIQLDAPTDPKVFLHRCGRAGRAGRRGLAVLFLSPGREEGYIDFLDVRKTPVKPLSLPSALSERLSVDEISATVQRMRSTVLKDRALHDKGMKAFVSHVRAHSKHQTASIFRVADIDWKDLADSFALLKMPRMPELKKLTYGIDLGVEIDLTTLAYKDKIREKARLAELSTPKPEWSPEVAERKKKKLEAWSGKTEKQEDKEQRRNRKRKRKELERQAKMDPDERAREDEWRELVEKVKKQKTFGKNASGEEEDDEFFKGFD